MMRKSMDRVIYIMAFVSGVLSALIAAIMMGWV